MNPTTRRRVLLVVFPLLASAAAAFGTSRTVHAEDPEQISARERCATRLSIALLGKAPSPALLAAANPQSEVDAMLRSPELIERFARFTNSEMNTKPGDTPDQDGAYFLARHVLQNGKPWKEIFVGAYGLDVTDQGVTVKDDPNGLGYFRTTAWLRRYAGNESEGYKISTAYRMMRNIVGLKLTAVTTAPNTDVSATGRRAAACAGCHYDNWYALDKVARVLTRRVGTGDAMKFVAPTDGPQQILDGATIADDKQLVTALVASDAFRFRTCRLAFQYLTGREENLCDGATFDACMGELAAKETVQSALAVVAKSPSFCQ